MIELIGVVVLIIILTVIVLGFLLPDKVHIERETEISASPETIFALISDFNEWPKWSPWAKLDPDTKYEISGDGVGHRMSWTSDSPKVGNGAQEIIELAAPTKMVTALDFGEMGKANATFLITEMGEQSKVVWSLDTNMRNGVPVLRQPIATFMGFFMEKFMDEPYREGLASLKREAEAASSNAA